MTFLEAQELAFEIKRETGALINLRQIGNGEWVVLVNLSTWVWSAQDWEQARKGLYYATR